ncbi:hypothetical protein KBY25_17170 [Ruegeria pomeroyi]|nr:hypothetical protein [Ruegeria pomeroyi]
MNNEYFSLSTNAFWVLKAGYESTHADIVDLVEDAEFDELHPLELIQRSQQALLSPISRIDQELGWLPELSGTQLRDILEFLQENRLNELRRAIGFLPDLPKANVLAHLCGATHADAELLQSLLRCWEDVDEGGLLRFINSQRQLSGFPQIDRDQLRTSIRALEAAHARTAAMAIWRLDEPGKVMEQLVDAELRNAHTSNILAGFVREYDNLSEPRLTQISSEIDEQIELARQPKPNLQSVTKEITDLLRRWDDVNQPVQVFEQHQGHEEGRSKKIYEKLRSLCLELANERGEFRHAKRLSEALLQTFPELESVAEVLRDDVEQLETLDQQQNQHAALEPLIEACEAAKQQWTSFKSGLRNKGFTRSAIGLSKGIFTSFEIAVKTPGLEDVAFLVVRDLALFINNEKNDPETAFRLIDGVINYNGAKPSRELLGKLEEERAVLHKNWKMEELKESAGNPSAMNRAIDEMLKYAQGKDRSELLELKSKMERRKTFRKIKNLFYLSFWGGIAAFIGFFVISEEINSPDSRSAPRTSTSSTSVQRTEVLPDPVFQAPGVMWNRTGMKGSAPFEIKTSPGSDYFVKLVDYQTGADAIGIFVKGGQVLEVQIPPGSYKMRYASGRTWRGSSHLFGPGQHTSFAQSTSRFDFTLYGGYTVELIRQVGGNMPTSAISKSQF